VRFIDVVASTPNGGDGGVLWHKASMVVPLPLPLLLNHDADTRIGIVCGTRIEGERLIARATVFDDTVWWCICAGGCLAVSFCAKGEVHGNMLCHAELREISLLVGREPANPECHVLRAWTVAEKPEVELTW